MFQITNGAIKINGAWKPPAIGFFKLKFDGSKLQKAQTSFGFIIRNINEGVIFCGANSINLNLYNLVAEAGG